MFHLINWEGIGKVEFRGSGEVREEDASLRAGVVRLTILRDENIRSGGLILLHEAS